MLGHHVQPNTFMPRELAPKATTKKVMEKKSFSLAKFKDNIGLVTEGDKDQVWIPVSSALSKALGVPGIPKGYFTISRGFSNTGKSTSLLEAVRGCQELGILPIIIDTETNISWKHAKTMGIEVEETINEETGEIQYGPSLENCMYVDCDYLINNYGKKRDKHRQVATIEDIAEFMNDMLNRQAKGELPVELCFFWDSAGTLDCDKGVMSNSANNQWNAGAMETAFKSLINQRIPLSRGKSKPYTNTFFVVNKIWLDSMQGKGVIKLKGGEAFFFACRFMMHFGGITSHGTKRLTATFKGRNYTFGTQSKISVAKNQVTDTVYDGTSIVSTAHGFIGADPASIAAYCKENKQFLLDQLNLSDEVGSNDEFDFEISAEDLPDSLEA
jgi:hypothetical protein